MFQHHKYHCFMLIMIIPVIMYAIPPDTLWTKTYGGGANDIGYSICPCITGGYLVAGYTSSIGSGPQSVFLVRLNENGDTLWMRAYGGSLWDGAHYIYETPDTCYLAAGYTESFGAGGKDIYLLKLNQQGDTIWTKTYGETLQDCAYAVCQAHDTGYLIVGYKNGPYGWVKGDLWILKINNNGDTLWTRVYGGSGEEYGVSIRHTLDNNYIISGINSSQSAGGKDVWLLKVNVSGDTIWTRIYGETLEDVGYGVNVTSDSGYVITGYINGTGSWTAGDLWLIRTNANGDSIWTREYGISGEDFGFEVYETPDLGFIVSGQTSLGAGLVDMWLVRTDADGDTIWTQTYGGAGRDASLGLCVNHEGGYVVVGHTTSYGSGNADVYVIKTNIDTGVKKEPGSSVIPAINIATVIKGPFILPTNRQYKVYNSLGRELNTKQLIISGIYFIKYDDKIVQKLILVK